MSIIDEIRQERFDRKYNGKSYKYVSIEEKNKKFSRWFKDEAQKCWDKMVPIFEKLDLTQMIIKDINSAPYVKKITVNLDKTTIHFFDRTDKLYTYEQYHLKKLTQMEGYILTSWIIENIKNSENYTYKPIRSFNLPDHRTTNEDLWGYNIGGEIEHKDQQIHLNNWS